MSWYLDIMKQNLGEDDRRWLQKIWAPTVVGVPPSDALRGLCVMPDGEPRCYGERDKQTVYGGSGEPIYLSSRNCGLSWTAHSLQGKRYLGASVRSPWSGKYVMLHNVLSGDAKGLYAATSMLGPDDPAPIRRRIDDKVYQVILPPVPMASRKRWLCGMHLVEDHHYHPVVACSDDDGESWVLHHLPACPDHEIKPPHRGLRWQNSGAEPSVIELPDGRVMLIARNSLNELYAYYSEDGGDTWTSGEPSGFHATLTTPALLRLHDGRVLLFWCNTQPLPEVNHEETWPPVNTSTINGLGEDVFTNRDANHAAITADGVHWTGFREMFLNEIRGRADFRSCGGPRSSADKSVHQFQALELPYNKVLVAFGQHNISRRMVIFDIDWLLETERHEDFSLGLDGISTHVFVKSVSGTPLYWKQKPGHCSWNRTAGAMLVPDPDATYGEVLQICRIHDPRLVSELQGAVWNFPAAAQGEVALELRIAGAGLRLSLTDRWFNVIDTTVADEAQFTVTLTAEQITPDVWHQIRLVFDREQAAVTVFDGETPLATLPIRSDLPNGFSYLHLQSLAEGADPLGTYVRRIDMHAN